MGIGWYFKNMVEFLECDMGLIWISEVGNSVDLMWGFNDGGELISEFLLYLMSYIVWLK